MGKTRYRRWRLEQEKLNRSPQDWRGNPVTGARTQAEADRIYGIGHVIEAEMCRAVVRGWLEPTGWVEIRFTSGDFDGLLPLGLQSYASRNPRDRAVYTGFEVVSQILFSDKRSLSFAFRYALIPKSSSINFA